MVNGLTSGQFMSGFVFLHIPKTAGTSFRTSLEVEFGRRRICYDYSRDSRVTSRIVKKYHYDQRDECLFGIKFNKKKYSWLVGHFEIFRYISIFKACMFLTFIRNPWDRMVSEYEHFVRDNGYKGSFIDVIGRSDFINRQSVMLANVPLQAIGFVGITELYESELMSLERIYGLRIPVTRENVSTDKSRVSFNRHDLDRHKAEFIELNKKDYVLYDLATLLSRQRSELLAGGKDVAHCAISSCASGAIEGWAWFENDNTPPRVKVYINNVHVDTVESDVHMPGPSVFFPERRVIGFVSKAVFNEDDNVECFIEQNGQKLTREYLINNEY
ncbi:sulfotransferase family 2 domain-containing protein [Larsenimonas rhizosphaerae]|uniref:Sulfotransferase family 2 domain-containing protein n=1 Tax=Larsenimonas rhizosphaerae TaxID=2944682 RepID=A0AA42CUM6_9GAMM|nr:sulfotransferase family 2 domain-containing protein [Larsenimonas rhizosphaerae]MCX2524842.1 sulfotransferase family 2 domain-containing protein [Larsenimonas rhizosphaerae]